MRIKTVLMSSTLAAFVATGVAGCSQSEEVRLDPAPPVKPAGTEPLPKETKKGGGPGSSGNITKNPGADS
jgi:hypothetical protein